MKFSFCVMFLVVRWLRMVRFLLSSLFCVVCSVGVLFSGLRW